MNEDFVTYEIAVKLKEKGFREKCLCRYRNYSKTLHINEVEPEFAREIDYSEFFKCYNSYIDSDIDAPTISQVMRWLREVKKLHLEISFWSTTGTWSCKVVKITNLPDGEWDVHRCESYEDAAIKAIEHLVKYWIYL